jgi:hypothetical protein
MAGKAQGRDRREAEPMTDRERSREDRERLERFAYHEAGHSVMAYYLHVTPGTVSIRPGHKYQGVSKHGKSGRPPVREGDLDVSIIEMRATLRRGLEKEIAISLAGKASERLVPTIPGPGYFGDPDREYAERLAALAVPTGREARSLALTERVGAGEYDMAKAESKAHGAVGRNLQGSYLRFLECVVDEIVASNWFRKLVEALVPPLMEHRVLSAAAVRLILTQVDPNTKEKTT